MPLQLTNFFFLQQLGIPLWAKSRVQTNLVVRDTKYNAKTRPYNNIVLPVFWMQLVSKIYVTTLTNEILKIYSSIALTPYGFFNGSNNMF